MTQPVTKRLETDTGLATGTEFQFNPFDNSLTIRKQDGEGEHWLTLYGYEALQLRRFLNEMLTKRRAP